MRTLQTKPKGHIDAPIDEVAESGTEVRILAPPSPSPCTMARVNVPVGANIAAHSHSVREVWVISQGAGYLTVDGEQSEVRAGDALFFESGEQHGVVNSGDQPLTLVAVWWERGEVEPGG